MSDTPRTDDEMVEMITGDGPIKTKTRWVHWTACAAIERELAAAKERIRRLEEALDTLNLVIGLTPIAGNKQALQEALDIARSMLRPKEAKP